MLWHDEQFFSWPYASAACLDMYAAVWKRRAPEIPSWQLSQKRCSWHPLQVVRPLAADAEWFVPKPAACTRTILGGVLSFGDDTRIATGGSVVRAGLSYSLALATRSLTPGAFPLSPAGSNPITFVPSSPR